jgi:hypothetical protein
MAQSIESKLQEFHQRISSSSIYYLIFIWFLRIVVFILSLGMWFIIWFLRLSFLLLREGIRRYVSTVAAIGLTLLQQQSHQEDTVTSKASEKEESAARSLDWAEPEEKATSPLLPVVVKDRVRICEENLAIQDRSVSWPFFTCLHYVLIKSILILSSRFFFRPIQCPPRVCKSRPYSFEPKVIQKILPVPSGSPHLLPMLALDSCYHCLSRSRRFS